jgi:N-hydroxyarylamine O-acetyltransferase
MIDLDAYFDRIGYSGPREPTLEVLRALHRLHPAAIPFENIDVLLGHGIDISPAEVDAKLIGARRGGYCFEQNNLFERVLTALGFQVEGPLGRVVWMAPPAAPTPPRTHRALKIVLDGETWLADVGFGGAVLTACVISDTRCCWRRNWRTGPRSIAWAASRPSRSTTNWPTGSPPPIPAPGFARC